MAAPLALAALLPGDVLARVQHVAVSARNVVLDAGSPRERRFAELKLGLRVTSFTRYNDTLIEFHARLDSGRFFLLRE